MNTNSAEKIRNGILGSVVGDALGVPAEFKGRQSLKKSPVTGMGGYGTHQQPPGTWSDDSSMSLCTAEVLAAGHDPDRIGQNFVRWAYDSHWTPHGDVFDIGGTTSMALEKIRNGTPPREAGETGEHSNGNGSLMRILPLLYESLQREDLGERYELVREVSSITHAHVRSCLACFWYLEFAAHLVHEKNSDLHDAYAAANRSFEELITAIDIEEEEAEIFSRLLSGKIEQLPETEVRTEGYVIFTLEAVVWCLLNSSSYKEAVLKAVNLGEDTDTTAAVAGGLAGMHYGREAIPQEWIKDLARLEEIEELLGRMSTKYSEK